MKYISTFEKFDLFGLFRRKKQDTNITPLDRATNSELNRQVKLTDGELYTKISRNEYYELKDNRINIQPNDLSKIYDSLSGWDIDIVDSKLKAVLANRKLEIIAIEDEYYICCYKIGSQMKTGTEYIFKCDTIDGLLNLINEIRN